MFKFAILLLAFSTIFITPFSATVSRVALNKLEVGGGVESVYYVKDDRAKSPIPGQIIDNTCCAEGFCLTQKLSIIYGVGDLVYVTLPGQKEETKQSIALPRSLLLPYDLYSEPMPGCETQQELKEDAESGTVTDEP